MRSYVKGEISFSADQGIGKGGGEVQTKNRNWSNPENLYFFRTDIRNCVALKTDL